MTTPMQKNGTRMPPRSARERLAAERRREEKLAVRRRNGLIALVAVVVVVATGVSIALAEGNGSGSASSGPLTIPAHASGTDGTVIVYGKADAPDTLDVYEDFRCPICGMLEHADGSTIVGLADNGTYKIQYHMGTFLDKTFGGNGSANALAAAGAALNESPEKFQQFRQVLFANQPKEQDDAFSDVNHLLALAGQVPGLTTPDFVREVKDGTYKAWANKVRDAFNASGVAGTPTLKLNGSKLTVFDSSNNPITPAQFQATVQQTIASKK